MIVVQCFLLAVWLLAVPTGVGSLFCAVDKKAGRLPFAWISGQIFLWALFQVICVPLILMEKDYMVLQRVYLAATGVCLAAAAARLWVLAGKRRGALRVVSDRSDAGGRGAKLLWALFWALFLLQMVQAVRLAYADTDDAFYVATSTVTDDAGTMYRKSPYTGDTSELDLRHCLAPFPVWITFLVRMSGIRSVSVAQVAVPLAMIAMAYGAFYLLGQKLCAGNRERLPLFLVFAELLVLFGDSSHYTVENFLIARSRQGKAALGSIVIPVLFLLLFVLLERLQSGHKASIGFWVLFASAMTSGCLCSTMGSMLCCMLVGIAALCGAVCYRQWKFLLPMAACCVPCAACTALYMLLT